MNLDESRGPAALDRSPAPPTHGGVRAESRRQRAARSERALRCSACRAVISDETQRIDVNGQHRHSRLNPHGLSFVFGCFRTAPGAVGVGEAIAEHTWFAGRTWQIACCGQCGEHLGWRYRGADNFYGLILARLTAS
jgi:hypothetical protein